MERVLCHSVQDVQRPTEGNQSIGWLHMREERERERQYGVEGDGGCGTGEVEEAETGGLPPADGAGACHQVRSIESTA
jgi:hypothetical protein